MYRFFHLVFFPLCGDKGPRTNVNRIRTRQEHIYIGQTLHILIQIIWYEKEPKIVLV